MLACMHAVMLACWHAAGAAPVEGLLGEDGPMGEREREALKAAREYRAADQYPIRDGHRTVFLFGAGEATLVCSPLNVCLIELQAGERVVEGGAQIGDSVRWRVSPAVGGDGKTHLAVKPIEAGLATTMALVTDRRTYHLRLVSRRADYMPGIAWHYPEAAEAAWASYHAAAEARIERETLPGTADRLGDLDFEYEMSGCRDCPWRPVRVYNDGQRTVVEVPAAVASTEAPALLVTDHGEDAIANYRVDGTRYVVDGVPSTVVLVAGVGRRQDKVTIRRRR